jgi:hypothetical protein
MENSRLADRISQRSSDASEPFDEEMLSLLPPDRRRPSVQRARAIDGFLEKPIFIAGMGRSGTTLLLRLLDGHPEIFVVPVESMLLTHFLPAYRTNGDIKALQEDVAARLMPMFRREAHLAVARAHMGKILTEAHASGAVTSRVIFRALLQCLAVEHMPDGKRVWLEKCPENELHLERIFEAFPKARVIFNVRDPRAVYYSFKKGRQSIPPETVGRIWAFRLQALLDFIGRKPGLKDRFYFLRYEDYVVDPGGAMGDLLEFLKLEKLATVNPSFVGKAFEGNSFDPSTNTRGRLDAEKADAWRNGLSAEEVRAVEFAARLEISLVRYPKPSKEASVGDCRAVGAGSA